MHFTPTTSYPHLSAKTVARGYEAAAKPTATRQQYQEQVGKYQSEKPEAYAQVVDFFRDSVASVFGGGVEPPSTHANCKITEFDLLALAVVNSDIEFNDNQNTQYIKTEGIAFEEQKHYDGTRSTFIVDAGGNRKPITLDIETIKHISVTIVIDALLREPGLNGGGLNHELIEGIEAIHRTYLQLKAIPKVDLSSEQARVTAWRDILASNKELGKQLRTIYLADVQKMGLGAYKSFWFSRTCAGIDRAVADWYSDLFHGAAAFYIAMESDSSSQADSASQQTTSTTTTSTVPITNSTIVLNAAQTVKTITKTPTPIGFPLTPTTAIDLHTNEAGHHVYKCEFFSPGLNEYRVGEYDQTAHQSHVRVVLGRLDKELSETHQCWAKTLYRLLIDIPVQGEGRYTYYALGDVDGDMARLYLAAVRSGHVILGKNALTSLIWLMNTAAKFSSNEDSYCSNPDVKAHLITLVTDSTYVRHSPNKLLCTGDIIHDRYTADAELNVCAVELFKRVTDASFVGGNHDISYLHKAGPGDRFFRWAQAEKALFDLIYYDGRIVALHNGFEFIKGTQRTIWCAFGTISFNSLEKLVQEINALDLYADYHAHDRKELCTYSANVRFTKENPKTNEQLKKDELFKNKIVLHGHDKDMDLTLSHIKCLNARLKENSAKTATYAAAFVCIKMD